MSPSIKDIHKSTFDMAPIRILLVGNGGREHALAWKLSQSPLVESIIAVSFRSTFKCLASCRTFAGDHVSLKTIRRL